MPKHGANSVRKFRLLQTPQQPAVDGGHVRRISLVALVLLFLSYAISRATSGAPSRGITGLGALGFFANALAGLLLVSHCAGDANVRSLWLCARNDLTQSLASRRPAERSG